MGSRWGWLAAAVASALGPLLACSLVFEPSTYEGGSGKPDGGGDGGGDVERRPDAACEASMTDPRNCGACGHDCQGRMCREGLCEPEVVVPDVNRPSALLYTEGQLYWTEPDAIRTVPVGSALIQTSTFPDAGGAQIPIALREAGIFVMAVTWGGSDKSQLYFAPKGQAFTAPMTKTVGTPERLLVIPTRGDATTVFVTTLGGGGLPGQILSVSGTAPDASVASFERAGTQPIDLVTNGTDLLFTAVESIDGGLEADSVMIHRVGTGPTVATTVVAKERVTSTLAVVQEHLYWGTPDRGGLVRRATLAGASVEDFVIAPHLEGNLGQSGTMLFWMTREAGSGSEHLALWGCAVARAPCRPLHLADVPADAVLGGAFPVTVALAGGNDWLYWTEPGRNVIKRVSTLTKLP